MGKVTTIAWTRSSRNFWAGCTKIGPGCDGCYAEAFQRWINGKDPETGEASNWGPGRPRIPYLDGAVKQLRDWNFKAGREREAGITWNGRPGFWPVFINSHSDFFDNEVPQSWRDTAIAVFEECTNLTIFLVTKRIGNAAAMVPPAWLQDGFPPHIRVLVTVVTQEEADRDIPKLLALPCKNGISCEPQIEAIDFTNLPANAPTLSGKPTGYDYFNALTGKGRDTQYQEIVGDEQEFRRIEWIIVGGESKQAGHIARQFNLEWARSIVHQCHAAGVPVFVKQLGSEPYDQPPSWDGKDVHSEMEVTFKDLAGADPAEWAEDLRIQEFPT